MRAIESRSQGRRIGAAPLRKKAMLDRAETAHLPGDQLSGGPMEAMNSNLYIPSSVTTIFMPMTLMTGIFGMNLGGASAAGPVGSGTAWPSWRCWGS